MESGQLQIEAPTCILNESSTTELSERVEIETPTPNLNENLNTELSHQLQTEIPAQNVLEKLNAEPHSGISYDFERGENNEETQPTITCELVRSNDSDALMQHENQENVDVENQGVIRLDYLHNLNEKVQASRQKKSRWLCSQLGSRQKCEQHDNFLNLTEEEIQAITNHNATTAVRKEAQFRKMYGSYATGVIGDEGIMKEMNEIVAKHDHMVAKKRWNLHQRWQRDVFENINDQIENKLKMFSTDQIKDKIRYFHYQYMKASNKRLLFLDILDHSYYNPFESLKHAVKYKANFCDPLKHDLEKGARENLEITGKISKDIRMRETLDSEKWHYSKFRSTIWGHLNVDEELTSDVPVKNLKTWKSSDVLYNNAKNSVGYVTEDRFPRGKRIVPNQGKGWSFRTKHEGKRMVHGLECMTQPKLQLYYT